MKINIPLTIGSNAIEALLQYCQEKNYHHFMMVADENTYAASGNVVETALRQAGHDVLVSLLHGTEVIADEERIVEVFEQCDSQARIFLAVGSGTLTDITRFVSHRCHSPFLSLPTAPSVDGFTSIGAPLVLKGLKRTVYCQPPEALFAQLPVLCLAPAQMCAAGFGDMIGKYLSSADWKLGHLLWDEPFDAAIYTRLQDITARCAANASLIGSRSASGIQVLMETLIQSGFCMLEFGNTAPASGAEHHISHFLEMKLLREKRKAILHGAKVGMASILSAAWYEQIRGLSRQQATQRLEKAALPDRSLLEQEMPRVFGPTGSEIFRSQSAFIDLSPAQFETLKERILAHWDDVLQIATTVPSAQAMSDLLKQAGAPLTPGELGFAQEEVAQAMQYSHYLRGRFTINKLRLLLGL